MRMITLFYKHSPHVQPMSSLKFILLISTTHDLECSLQQKEEEEEKKKRIRRKEKTTMTTTNPHTQEHQLLDACV